jgi:hypothetical protein
MFAPSALADPAQNTTVPVSFVTYSRCPDDPGGELVAFDGVMHLTYAFTANPTGGFVEHFHANTQLSGIGLTTGDRYVSTAASNLGEVTSVNSRSIVTDIEHVQQVHAGEAVAGDDFSMRIVLSAGGLFVDHEGCS